MEGGRDGGSQCGSSGFCVVAILLESISLGLELGIKALESVLSLLVEDEVFQRRRHFDRDQVFGGWEVDWVDNLKTSQSHWQCKKLMLRVVWRWSSS